MHPDLDLGFYTGMLRGIKERFPAIHVHGFSPPEIAHIASAESMSVAETIAALRDAGLDSIPGGGAEILTDPSRRRVSPGKCSAGEWLGVMEAAHEAGMRTTATMMFGHGETVEERVDHLLALRALQDRTGGFTAFIPWSFQPGNTELANLEEPGGHDYLRTLAASRLALDNFDNIQASWVTQGAAVAQTALFFGANDFGSTMIEENVVAAAGVTFRLSREEIERLIRRAGFAPCRRGQAYNILAEDR
jgi:cyclic dehypoxanthinyl futalosine synthase